MLNILTQHILKATISSFVMLHITSLDVTEPFIFSYVNVSCGSDTVRFLEMRNSEIR